MSSFGYNLPQNNGSSKSYVSEPQDCSKSINIVIDDHLIEQIFSNPLVIDKLYDSLKFKFASVSDVQDIRKDMLFVIDQLESVSCRLKELTTTDELNKLKNINS